MSLKIKDVKGDGNCFYRCIWNIIKDDDKAKDDLMLIDTVNEDDGCLEIRYYIVMTLKHADYAKDMLKNILELSRAVPDISELYPFLEDIGIDTQCNTQQPKSFQHIIDKICDIIENTNIMASELETSIISATLIESDISLIILTQDYHETEEDIADKWLYQLQKILPKVTTNSIATIINLDNIHYKYMTFMNKVIYTTKEFTKYVEKCASTSEEDN